MSVSEMVVELGSAALDRVLDRTRDLGGDVQHVIEGEPFALEPLADVAACSRFRGLGMRERAQPAGGSLSAGPDSCGWRVVLVLRRPGDDNPRVRSSGSASSPGPVSS